MCQSFGGMDFQWMDRNLLGFIKVRVKSILNACSEFVTPQKNVLLTTQPNLNAKKTRQVNTIRYQNELYSLLSNAGGMSTGDAETMPIRRKAAVSLNCLPLAAA